MLGLKLNHVSKRGHCWQSPTPSPIIKRVNFQIVDDISRCFIMIFEYVSQKIKHTGA